ncbi:MAG: DUF4325 domain-containing protein [bacterium]|nr:DUF4325 domain-containing protein [bacterium]
MDLRAEIIKFIRSRKVAKTSEIAGHFRVSRQYASRLLNILVNSGEIIKSGSTKSAQYTVPEFADEFGLHSVRQRLTNHDLKEHEVMEEVFTNLPAFKKTPENVQSILRYAFSEMLNNAIEHSKSTKIEVEISDNQDIKFIVNDFGIGVFRNIMKKRGLRSELEAMQDLLKGKTTTAPAAHSGEGIFFTSKAGDKFILESFGYRLVIDNNINDIFFGTQKPSKKGTRVIFSISKNSPRHLSDIFVKFRSNPKEIAFDKTEIHVRLFTMGTIYISRSQARRILAGLEKFKSITLDFERVPAVGQAFSDEIFRVFKAKHPKIVINPINMNEAVKFMVERAGTGTK